VLESYRARLARGKKAGVLCQELDLCNTTPAIRLKREKGAAAGESPSPRGRRGGISLRILAHEAVASIVIAG
jgi:hypothetical protein